MAPLIADKVFLNAGPAPSPKVRASLVTGGRGQCELRQHHPRLQELAALGYVGKSLKNQFEPLNKVAESAE
jgi:hypothetical protein